MSTAAARQESRYARYTKTICNVLCCISGCNVRTRVSKRRLRRASGPLPYSTSDYCRVKHNKVFCCNCLIFSIVGRACSTFGTPCPSVVRTTAAANTARGIRRGGGLPTPSCSGKKNSATHCSAVRPDNAGAVIVPKCAAPSCSTKNMYSPMQCLAPGQRWDCSRSKMCGSIMDYKKNPSQYNRVQYLADAKTLEQRPFHIVPLTPRFSRSKKKHDCNVNDRTALAQARRFYRMSLLQPSSSVRRHASRAVCSTTSTTPKSYTTTATAPLNAHILNSSGGRRFEVCPTHSLCFLAHCMYVSNTIEDRM